MAQLISIFVLVAVMFSASVAAAGPAAGDQTAVGRFTANTPCEGGNHQSKAGPNPKDHVWGVNQVTMLAVAPDMYHKMKGCKGKLDGRDVQVLDLCPAKSCGSGLRKIDLMMPCGKGSVDPPIKNKTITWSGDCKINGKQQHSAEKTKNKKRRKGKGSRRALNELPAIPAILVLATTSVERQCVLEKVRFA